MRGRGGQASSCLNWWVLRTSPLKLASHIRDPGRAQYSRGGWPTVSPRLWGKKQAPYSPSRSLFPTRQNFSLGAGKETNKQKDSIVDRHHSCEPNHQHRKYGRNCSRGQDHDSRYVNVKQCKSGGVMWESSPLCVTQVAAAQRGHQQAAILVA